MKSIITRIFGATIILLFASTVSFAQWAGSSDSLNTIYRFGNVGIGTSSPVEKLHVYGNSYFQGLHSIAGVSQCQSLKLGYGSGFDAILTSHSANENLHIYANGTGNTLLQEFGGNVGIGTTSPSTSLHVFSSTTSPIFRVECKKADENSVIESLNDLGRKFQFKMIGSSKVESGLLSNKQNAGVLQVNGAGGMVIASWDALAPIIFATGGTTFANERMRIDASGNVGIGTTDPNSSKMEIYSTNANPSLKLTTSSTTYDPGIQFASGDSNSWGIRVDGEDSHKLKFDYGWGTSKIAFDSDGNVGIGTTNPEKALHIYSDVASSIVRVDSKKTDGFSVVQTRNDINSLIQIKMMGSMSAGTALTTISNSGVLQSNGSGGIAIVSSDVNAPIRFGVGGADYSNEALRIASSGNVGIGTTDTFGYKLAVNGTIGAKEVIVETTSTWPDYVFEENYDLPSLSEVEEFTKENKHLPNVPNQKAVEENGIAIGEMNAVLLQKIEELTLYVININKEVNSLKKENHRLKHKIEKVESQQ